MEIARHGTVYTALPAYKLQGLKQFAIHIDLTTSSDGLSAFEKIFSCFVNQEEMNFLLGQWKDGLLFHLRNEKQIQGLKFGSEGVLKKEGRTQCLITYDGAKLSLYQDGKVRRYRETGPLNFANWDRTYPLVVGTDAHGRSQWKGSIYEIAVFDRAVTSKEVTRLSSPSSLSGRKDQKVTGDQWPVTSEGTKTVASEGKEKVTGDQWLVTSEGTKTVASGQWLVASEQTRKVASEKKEDQRPLIHYVFSHENTYQTTFRGGKAIGIKDLGKGEPADLVIPEQFTPYQRAYLGWDTDWMKRSGEWLDLAVNILGFVPFGMLALLTQRSRQPTADSRKQRSLQPTADSQRPTETRQENPPMSPFMKGEGLIVVVVLAVVVGFGVSLAIEWLQAYLPSRDSSLRDLGTNVLGTFIGAIVAAYLLKRDGGSGLASEGIKK